MVKTVPAALQTHLEGHNLTLATLWKVTRTDGQVFTFTDHRHDLDFDDGAGSLTYQSAVGYTRSAVASTATLSVDNMEIQAVFDNDNVTSEDIQAGRWDFAEVHVFLVNYEDITNGAIKIRRGWLGEIRFADTYTTELNGLLQILQTELVELTGPICRANFGDKLGKNRCKIDGVGTEWSAALTVSARADFDAAGEFAVFPTTPNDRWYITKTTTDPLPVTGGGEPAWPTTIGATVNDNGILWEAIQAKTITVTIDVVTDQTEFTVITSTDAPDGFFKAGYVTFVSSPSGDNNGLREGIASWDLAGKRLKFREPIPFLVASGDTLTMHAGCDKTPADCAEYDNKWNFRGEDFLPGKDQIFQIPDSPPAG